MEPTVAFAADDPRAPAGSGPAARLEEVLRFAASRAIVDVYLKAGQRPLYRRFGQLISRRDEATFGGDDLLAVVTAWLPPGQAVGWRDHGRATWVHGLVGAGRFRVTALRSGGEVVLAIHILAHRLANLRELNLPRSLAAWAQWSHGLVLVASAPGHGRTTTWLALLEQVNTSAPSAVQVVTLEDHLEQHLDDKVAFVQQREIGRDVPDLTQGLQDALAQHADVIGIGDLQPEAVAAAAAVAGLQRLVVGCTRGADAIDVVRLAVAAQPPHLREAMRAQLARRLRGVVHTVLVPAADGKSMLPASEVLVVIPAVAEFLRSDRDLDGLAAFFDSAASRPSGMISRDASLAEWVQQGQLSLETAQRFAKDAEALRARIGGGRLPQAPLSTTAAVQAMVLPPTGQVVSDTEREPLL